VVEEVLTEFLSYIRGWHIGHGWNWMLAKLRFLLWIQLGVWIRVWVWLLV
jgi:hypothetical protein